MNTYRILIADDEQQICKIMTHIGLNMGWQVDQAANGEEALRRLETGTYQIFILDVKMPPPAGIDLARIIMEREEAPAILILTGYANIPAAVQAMKEGIFDYIPKETISLDSLESTLRRAAEYHENCKKTLAIQKEREKEMDNIKEANFQFQSMIELSSSLLFIAQARTGQFTDCNSSFYQHLGYSRKEILQKQFWEIDPELSEQGWKNFIDEIRNHPSPSLEHNFIRKDRMPIPVEISLTYVCVKSGEFIVGVAHDISERQKILALLHHEQNILHLLLDNIPDRIFFKDTNSRFTRINKALAKRLGIQNPSDIVGKSDFDFSPEEFARSTYEEEQQVICTHKPIINKLQKKSFPDSSHRWSLVTKVPIFDQENKITGIIGISRDITDLKEIEENLQEKSDILSCITSSAQDGIIMLDKHGLISFWNPAATQIFGYESHEIMGKELHAILAPEKYYKEYHNGFRQFIATGTGKALHQTLELMAIKKDGTIFPIELSLSAAYFKESWHAIGIVRDISIRKQHEQEIKTAQEQVQIQSAQLHSMLNEMEEGMVLSDQYDVITNCNDWFVRLAKIPKEFVVGQKLDKIVHLISGCLLHNILNGYRTGEYTEKTSLQACISDMQVMLTLQPLFRDDRYQGTILTILDVTDFVSEQKKVEMENTQKNNSLIDAWINMNTPVKGILDITEQLLKTTLTNEQRLLLETIQDCGNIITDIANQYQPSSFSSQ